MGLLKILHQDDDLVAIDKPSGLLVHRTRIAHDSTVALQLLRDQLNRFVYPVHRLDRATSGVLLFALSPESAAALVDAFTRRAVRKRYLAVVRGYTEEAGTIDHPLAEEPGMPPQEAVTEYRRLATAELPVPMDPAPTARYSLVEARPHSGRQHQIRRHLKHIFHPVIGDTRYGDSRHNRLFRERFNLHRLLLVAQRIELAHPRTGATLAIEAPMPEELAPMLAALGWTWKDGHTGQGHPGTGS